MTHKKNIFTTPDGVEIFYQSWLPEARNIKAILQISHGMAEHSLRYAEFAAFLNASGIGVYANDHRGHGNSIPKGAIPGYFAERDGWNLVLQDMHQLTSICKQNHPDIPFFLLGHSMGSFLSRKYAGLWASELKGLIISGTGSNPQWLLDAGLGLAKMMPANSPSKFIDNMVFGKYNRSYASPFQWLSSDQKKVDEYVADPLCGFVCTGSFFRDMFVGLKMLNDKRIYDNVSRDLPVYLFSGKKDPVGDFGKGVQQVTLQFQRDGFKNVTEKFYYDGRHEMLNETNRDEVYQDVLDWINLQLNN